MLEQKIANPLLDFSSSTHSSKLIQAIIELICNEDTTQVMHFPNEKEQQFISKYDRHSGRYFHYPDSDSEDDEHGDETKLWFLIHYYSSPCNDFNNVNLP